MEQTALSWALWELKTSEVSFIFVHPSFDFQVLGSTCATSIEVLCYLQVRSIFNVHMGTLLLHENLEIVATYF